MTERQEADFGTIDRAKHSALVIERETQTDATGKVTGTTHRARNPTPTALHFLAMMPNLQIGEDLVRVGEEMQSLAQKAGLVARQGPSWARDSIGGPEMHDAQAEALQGWQAALNAIDVPVIRSVVRNVCLCDEVDGRGGYLRIGLEKIKRHWGW
jgi:hypothetical protein